MRVEPGAMATTAAAAATAIRCERFWWRDTSGCGKLKLSSKRSFTLALLVLTKLWNGDKWELAVTDSSIQEEFI